VYVILWNLVIFWYFFLLYYFLVLYVTGDQNYSSHNGILENRTRYLIYLLDICISNRKGMALPSPDLLATNFMVGLLGLIIEGRTWAWGSAAGSSGARREQRAAQAVAWPPRTGVRIKQ
jgi:hypothetical protein